MKNLLILYNNLNEISNISINFSIIFINSILFFYLNIRNNFFLSIIYFYSDYSYIRDIKFFDYDKENIERKVILIERST